MSRTGHKEKDTLIVQLRERITKLEGALEKLMDDYQYQIDHPFSCSTFAYFYKCYDAASEVLENRLEE